MKWEIIKNQNVGDSVFVHAKAIYHTSAIWNET